MSAENLFGDFVPVTSGTLETTAEVPPAEEVILQPPRYGEVALGKLGTLKEATLSGTTQGPDGDEGYHS